VRGRLIKNNSNSDAGQDLFALQINNHMLDGVFVDIGCSDYQRKNNTLLLESEFGWTGIGIDLVGKYKSSWRHSRPNSTFIIANATMIDYKKLFGLFPFEEHNLPKVIHYVSIDIDPTYANLVVLKSLPFDDYIFNAITFEHNLYLKDSNSTEGPHVERVKNEAKEFMASQGYTLRKEDVEFQPGKPFEDWYTYE